MADGDIDFDKYSVEQLVGLIKRIDQHHFPLNYAKARAALQAKWPDAPDDLTLVTADNLPAPRVPMQVLADGSRQFHVHFDPPVPAGGKLHVNDQNLGGTGTVTVGPASVTFTELRHGASYRERSFALADVANVEWSEVEGVLIVRTRNDPRFVTLWLQLPEEAAALKGLLPSDFTPAFIAQRQHEDEFASQMNAVAPRAWVTPALIAVNVVVFIIMAMNGAGLVEPNGEVHLRFGSNFGPFTWTGEPWRLLTSAFLHFGVFHIAFNMYALYNGGMLTERLYGSGRFLAIYLLAAVAGSVVSGWWEPVRNSAGASGAVFGVYGALLAFFVVRRQDIPARLLQSAGKGALLLCGYSLFMGATSPIIDNACHVGGLLGGAAAGFLLARPFNVAARAVPRPGQVAGVAAVILAALALLSMPLWSASGSRHVELASVQLVDDFAPEEERLVNQYLAISRQVDSGALGLSQGADRLEREVLEPWRAASQPLLRLKVDLGKSSKMTRRLRVMQEYLEAREKALRMQVSLMRDTGEFTLEQVNAQWEHVGALLQTLNAKD